MGADSQKARAVWEGFSWRRAGVWGKMEILQGKEHVVLGSGCFPWGDKAEGMEWSFKDK